MSATLLVWACLAATGSHAGSPPDFVAASERAAPAVVKVQSALAPGRAAHPPLDEQDFFAVPEHHGFTGSGSGFIVSADGVVLTNHHVIANAGAIRVQLADRRSFPASLIGSDPPSDIAVLKIAASDLPVIQFGDSDTLRPGDWVLAIGSPFEMDFSVTAGIVSAKGRSLGPEQRFVAFLQTDVAINRGNSGGPLLDLGGRVVGMNSAIFSQTGGFVGLSFAIPASTVMDVTAQIRSNGRVRRGFLGVGYQDLSPELAQALHLRNVDGALINQIQPDSAAAQAGIQEGDVVLQVGETTVHAAADLPPLIGMHLPETTVELVLQRSGKPLRVPVKLGQLPIERTDRVSPAVVAKDSPDIELADAGKAELAVLGVDRALLVISAGPTTLAHGLRRGDAIVAILGREVLPSAAELQAELASSTVLAMLVRRELQRLFIGWSTAEPEATLH